MQYSIINLLRMVVRNIKRSKIKEWRMNLCSGKQLHCFSQHSWYAHWLPVVRREQTKTRRQPMRPRRQKQGMSYRICQRSICPSGNITQMIMSIIRSGYPTAKLRRIRLMKRLLFLYREIISPGLRTEMEPTPAKQTLTLRSTVIRQKPHPL